MVVVDLDAVRTFVAAADAGQFQEAAADPYPALTALRRYLAAREPGRPAGETWTPKWARR
jgi:hypothetical protein